MSLPTAICPCLKTLHHKEWMSLLLTVHHYNGIRPFPAFSARKLRDILLVRPASRLRLAGQRPTLLMPMGSGMGQAWLGRTRNRSARTIGGKARCLERPQHQA